MGRSNVCVFHEYEGIFYVDNKYLNHYSGHVEGDPLLLTVSEEERDDDHAYEDFDFDRFATDQYIRDVISEFTDSFAKRFQSFSRCAKTINKLTEGLKGDYVRAVLESSLFYVCVEDNEDSVAFELIQNPDASKGFQKRYYKKYLEGIRDCLFEQFPEIDTYAGWFCRKTLKEGETE